MKTKKTKKEITELVGEFKKISKFINGMHTINYREAKMLPQFSYLKDGNTENKLKTIASEIGSFSVVNGTTEFDIPTFLRKQYYNMSNLEMAERIYNPEKFKTAVVYVSQNEIMKRECWTENMNNKTIYLDRWYIDRHIITIERDKLSALDDSKLIKECLR